MTLMSDLDRSVALDALLKWLDDQKIDPYNGVPILCEAVILACISMEKNADKPLVAAVNRMKMAARLMLESGESILADPERYKIKRMQ